MHPLAGTWIADVDRSRRDANHQFQQATIRFEVTGTSVSLAYGGINAGGRQEHGRQTLHADGREHPLAEAPEVLAVATLEPRALRTAAFKGRNTIGRASYEVSEDGRTMTAVVSGIDAAGKTFDQIIAFNRDSGVTPSSVPQEN